MDTIYLDEFCILSEKEEPDQITIRLKPADKIYACPICNERNVRKYDQVVRTVRDIPKNGKDVYLVIYEHRYFCRHCRRVFYPRFRSISHQSRLTDRFRSLLLSCCQKESTLAVAKEFRISEGALRKMKKKIKSP